MLKLIMLMHLIASTPAWAQEEIPPDTTASDAPPPGMRAVPAYRPLCKHPVGAFGCITMYGGIAVGVASLWPMGRTQKLLTQLENPSDHGIDNQAEWDETLAKYRRNRTAYYALGLGGLGAYVLGGTTLSVDAWMYADKNTVYVQIGGEF